MGVKAEVEKSTAKYTSGYSGEGEEAEERERKGAEEVRGRSEWVELTVEIPGFRDDDSMPVFLAAMLSEALLADGDLAKKLWINRRYHWKLCIDVSFRIFGLRLDADLNPDSAAFAAAFLSSTVTLAHYTSCAAVDTVT